MHDSYLNDARRLNDEALLKRVAFLAAQSRRTTAELIAHLAEVDTRKLYLASGYSSMFLYCVDGLRLSEYGAYNRIVAARAARRFPAILDLLVEGALNLATVRLLAPHLTRRNCADVLEAARGLRKRDVEALVATLAPQPDVPMTVRRLPSPPSPPAPVPAPASVPATPFAAPGVSAPASLVPDALPTAISPTATPAPPSRAEIAALSPDRYKMQLTIGGDTLEMFELAKDLLRHAEPSGNAEAILKRALSALLDDLMKKKFAATGRPRTCTATTPGSRHVPAEVQRAVYLRDDGGCAFMSASGRRCGARSFLEFHHVQPYAHGGQATVDNIELRCRAHNLYEWEKESTQLRMQELEWHERELWPGPAQRAGRGS